MKKSPRRPKCSEDIEVIIDLYWDQFCEASDPPSATVNVGDNCYDVSTVGLMRKQAKWMLKAADWMEDQYKKGKVK